MSTKSNLRKMPEINKIFSYSPAKMPWKTSYKLPATSLLPPSFITDMLLNVRAFPPGKMNRKCIKFWEIVIYKQYLLHDLLFIQFSKKKSPQFTVANMSDSHHFADDILKCIFVKENHWTSIKIALNCVSQCPIHNKSALVHVMAWRQTIIWTNAHPDLCHPMVTRPQCVNLTPGVDFSDRVIIHFECSISPIPEKPNHVIAAITEVHSVLHQALDAIANVILRHHVAILLKKTKQITMTSYKRHGVSNQRQLCHLFNDLFSLTTTKIPELHITCPFEGNTLVTCEFPSEGTVMRKVLLSYDVIMIHRGLA